ncbi:hypothetical protein QJ857_gp0097 [Tupanvirus soda lake]|uniref:Uncharacterized protein n=2 Tax=Tupanvirus TaxID=2094720 RepID=A0A6N1NXE5_9VIRU|nr:hypothetical protein QJ857_gp0097 [Tupanvirus soda lake]QKU35926.1 hypothetical protein [Tupanvirus soda lake]
MDRYSKSHKLYTIFNQTNENNIDDATTLLNSLKSNENGINYGCMWYNNYYYKVYDTSDNIDNMVSSIQCALLLALENKSRINLILYQVEDIDPRFVSRNFIESSTFPWCKIKIDGNSKKICTFYGNQSLFNQIYPKLSLLDDYQRYVNDIEWLDEPNLNHAYEQVFNKKASFIFNKKEKILKKLVKQKKFELVNTYKNQTGNTRKKLMI